MKKVLILLLLISFSHVSYSVTKTELLPVKAVAFYKPGCCREFFSEVLPELTKKYGRSLQLLVLDNTQPEAGKLYLSVLIKRDIPLSQGLPLLIAGRESFRSLSIIKETFSSFVEEKLARGGEDWPEIPRLKKILKEIKHNPESRLGKLVSDNFFYSDLSLKENILKNFNRDPLAYILAVATELLMVFSLFASSWFFFQKTPAVLKILSPRLLPILSLLGLSIAIYLSVIKLTESEPVCGPVGDCVSVQESSYAELFGLIPVSILGAVCFLLIIALWALRSYGPADFGKYSDLAIRIILMAGVAFFIYLTFLEIFIIGAVCLWCLTAAAIMTLQLWTSVASNKFN